MEKMDRNQLLFLARLAEQAKRFDEMAEAMRLVALMDKELTAMERNWFSTAYKQVISSRMASWRMLLTIEQEEEKRNSNEQNVRWIKDYKKKVEDELAKICNDAIAVLDSRLIPSSKTYESNVFYFKLKADYHRYLAEFYAGDQRKEVVNKAHETYKHASKIASSKLPVTHPTRLGLALNFSVFQHEILNSTESARLLATEAFDAALVDLDTLSEKACKESTSVLQLIKDNLTLWNNNRPT